MWGVVQLCNIRAIIRAHADEFSFLLDITVDMSLRKLGITVLIHRKFNEVEKLRSHSQSPEADTRKFIKNIIISNDSRD